MATLVFILLLLALNGVVSLIATAFMRSVAIAVVASTIVTELVVAIYGLVQASSSPDAADVILGVVIVAICSTPVILGTSAGFVFGWRRFHHKRV